VRRVDAHTDPRVAAGDSIQRQSIRSVICAPIGSKARSWGVCYVDNLTKARAFDDEELEFATAVARQSGLVLEDLHLVDEQGQMIESFIRTLAASIDARDDATAGHSARVGAYSAGIARTMGMAREECRSIYYAGLLHDYGKIGIRDDLLLKAAELTREEYEQIKEHAQHTFRILSKIRFPEALANIPLVASCHHERWDGSGYPRGIVGEQIPLGSRIVAVADAYDALVEERVYSKAVPAAAAVAEIVSRAKTHFDPKVVEAFVIYFNQDLRPHRNRRAKTGQPINDSES
jgi:HD-GYP domain-containing protein (c-di-GMP phosphodiesterase class II)